MTRLHYISPATITVFLALIGVLQAVDRSGDSLPVLIGACGWAVITRYRYNEYKENR